MLRLCGVVPSINSVHSLRTLWIEGFGGEGKERKGNGGEVVVIFMFGLRGLEGNGEEQRLSMFSTKVS